MDEAGRTRRAARDAVRDVSPAALRDEIDGLLESRSMSPGALVLYTALNADGSLEADGIADRAAGVQLIYDGLRLTRELSHAEPWDDPQHRDEADMQILAADVMVARGFYLLARTGAADRAVQTVRAFGRDQTHRRTTGDTTLDAALESNVLELALIAGYSAAGIDPPPEQIARIEELGRSMGVPLPPAETLLAELDGRTPTSASTEDGVSAPDG